MTVALNLADGRLAAPRRPARPTDIQAEDGLAPSTRAMVSVCVMMATIMQAIDTTIANVALPYMQGSLSTTQDQANWVLTSYITAAAIMTSPLGWMAGRFGRKRLFLVCTAGFTVASMLCGLAQTIEQMVLFRVMQGVFGAALAPLSQAVMLDSYPQEKRGSAMAIWGMGIMIGPIMGPTLGGWLTDNYSWRWVFYVNLPFGVLTVLGLSIFMKETKIRRDLAFSWFGFLSLSLGIGSLQMMLDRGQELGWFDSPEIVVEALLSIAGFYFFLVDSFTSTRPFISIGIFRDRNYAIGVVLMFLNGVVLLATMALVTPFLQTLLGYPVLSSGILLGARGVGHVRCDGHRRPFAGHARRAAVHAVRLHAGDAGAMGDDRLEPRRLGQRRRGQRGVAGLRPRLLLCAAQHRRILDPGRARSAPRPRHCGRWCATSARRSASRSSSRAWSVARPISTASSPSTSRRSATPCGCPPPRRSPAPTRATSPSSTAS